MFAFGEGEVEHLFLLFLLHLCVLCFFVLRYGYIYVWCLRLAQKDECFLLNLSLTQSHLPLRNGHSRPVFSS